MFHQTENITFQSIISKNLIPLQFAIVIFSTLFTYILIASYLIVCNKLATQTLGHIKNHDQST